MIVKSRIVTWNMGGFSFKGKQAEAWGYLENDLRPDLALLQEAPRRKYDELCKLGQAFAYQGGEFGTMLYCSKEHAASVNVNEGLSHCSSAMYLSAVEILGPAGPALLMSVHVNPDRKHKANLKVLIEKLAGDFKAAPIIVGGDFNACRHYDVVHKKNACSWFFREMERIGFYDCHFGLHGVEKRTYWSKKTTEPYQDDHFFIPTDWRNRIDSCEVLPYDPSDGLSDHGPVELFINLA